MNKKIDTKFPYHVPVLSTCDIGIFRLFGPGLGNLMFPMARALIGSHTQGGTYVMPTIRQLKIGPYLRNEHDKRAYGKIFRKRNVEEIRAWLYSTYNRAFSSNENEDRFIYYQGLGNQFYDLHGHEDFVKNQFLEISREKEEKIDYDIAVHVRRGDFGAERSGAATQNIRIPLDWYRGALELAKKKLDISSPKIIIFSDEDPTDIIQNLALEHAQPDFSSNALTSMLLMSNAKCLVGSRSTFSLWGQYFGGIQAIWPEGFDLYKYKPYSEGLDEFF